MKRRTIVFGPPGTGKTTWLLRELERLLKRRIVAPERVGFVSFSRRAVKEAKDRAAAVVDGPTPHFRTIHATAYHLLELQRGDVLDAAHLKDFAERVGLELGTSDLWEGTPGDRCLALHALARARGTTAEAEWRRLGIPDLDWAMVARTVALYERFKTQHYVLDFADMLARAETSAAVLDVDVLFVDEAQDNSAAQWAFLRRAAAHVPRVYLAGDDDQAVYAWSGADPAQLLRFNGERTVLPVSYRLPGAVKALADRLVARIRERVPKTFAPRDDAGRVDWVPELDGIDLHGAGTWLLLARSNYQLGELRQLARRQGVVYSLPDGEWSWMLPAVQAALTYERLRKGHPVPRDHARRLGPYLPHKPHVPASKKEVGWSDVFGEAPTDRTWMEALSAMPVRDVEYIRALRRTGESLTKPGRVRIGTVHSVKGAEADHVVVVTDVSERVAAGARSDPDAELRVQYVAATRARQTLRLLQPRTPQHWAFAGV